MKWAAWRKHSIRKQNDRFAGKSGGNTCGEVGESAHASIGYFLDILSPELFATTFHTGADPEQLQVTQAKKEAEEAEKKHVTHAKKEPEEAEKKRFVKVQLDAKKEMPAKKDSDSKNLNINNNKTIIMEKMKVLV